VETRSEGGQVADIVEEGTFEPGDYSAELGSPDAAVGTRLLLENERLRVWEVRLGPGERAPFHRHVTPYFWSCVDAGTGRQRHGDGTVRVRRYRAGETEFWYHSPEEDRVHDLENVGATVLRFVTVELVG
jgi:predicted metal-dependent enzyme (double-stranded beta helix superfamily)